MLGVRASPLLGVWAFRLFSVRAFRLLGAGVFPLLGVRVALPVVLVRAALVDIGPLRTNPTFRRLWLGTVASGFGGQFGQFALLYYLWERTHSATVVGLSGLFTGVPMIVLALAGSAFADHVDRRRLALGCTYGNLIVCAGMTVVAGTGVGGVPAMLVLSAMMAGLGALGSPARRSLMPGILSGGSLAAGLALDHMSFQLVLLAGPAAAGLLTASFGLTWCFAFDTVTFVAALIGLSGLPPAVRTDKGAPGVRAVLAGLRYAASTPAVRGALLADLAATVLAMPVVLFPVLNAEKFGGHPSILGLFTSSLAVGGVTASVFSGLATRRTRPGVTLLICGAIWSIALGAAGLFDSLPPVLAMIAIAGAADTWAVVSRGTVVQTTTPESYRGRISALEHVVGVAGPQLGGLRAGLVASATSAGVSLALGGLAAVLATSLIALTAPQLRAETTPAREPA